MPASSPRRSAPLQEDYSPQQVADRLNLERRISMHRSKSWVYSKINSGEIQAVVNEHGHYRITADEYERIYQMMVPKSYGEQAKRELQAAAAHDKRAKYSAQEIGEQLLRGRLHHYGEIVDPEHTLRVLDPEDYYKRVEAMRLAQLERMRAERFKRQERAEKHGRKGADR